MLTGARHISDQDPGLNLDFLCECQEPAYLRHFLLPARTYLNAILELKVSRTSEMGCRCPKLCVNQCTKHLPRKKKMLKIVNWHISVNYVIKTYSDDSYYWVTFSASRAVKEFKLEHVLFLFPVINVLFPHVTSFLP